MKKITIIVGAGASNDFRIEKDGKIDSFGAMPTGEKLIELVSKIDNNLLPNPDALHFAKLIQHYQPFSIDEFLNSIKNDLIDIDGITDNTTKRQDKEELIQAGICLIAYFLLKAEKKQLFENLDAVLWYRHLRNLIITSGKTKQEIEDNLKNLTIISFNYDRSLDYFLQTRLGNFYDKINVIYPYGSLSDNSIMERLLQLQREIFLANKTTQQKEPTQQKTFNSLIQGSCNLINKHIKDGIINNYGTYKEDLHSYLIAIELSQQIKIIGEIEEKEKEKIKEAMSIEGEENKNKKFYFLGFAFHPQNCELLGLEKIKVDYVKHNSNRLIPSFHSIHYTNFDNSKKIEDILVSNLSDNFKKYPHKSRSEKGVYDALRYDFDLSFL
jgi:hypothetical protein